MATKVYNHSAFITKLLSKQKMEMGVLPVPEVHRTNLIDSRYVKNTRPLTILNNDLKILSKALDNRLKEVIPKLISSDQTGFVKGRQISHNNRRSLDVINYVNNKKLPALILSIDMEKCFDRLEHNSIFASLRYFNFEDEFINWIRLFYTDFQICVQNFGEKFFKNFFVFFSLSVIR